MVRFDFTDNGFTVSLLTLPEPNAKVEQEREEQPEEE